MNVTFCYILIVPSKDKKKIHIIVLFFLSYVCYIYNLSKKIMCLIELKENALDSLLLSCLFFESSFIINK